jgi:hypothetical protein
MMSVNDLSEKNACLVCSRPATFESYGYWFCEPHSKYGKIDPEALEPLVMWRLRGLSVKEIENRLDRLLEENIDV